MSTGGWLHNMRRRRKSAQDVTSFKALVATPASLGSAAVDGSLDALGLPANGNLALSIDAVTVTGDVTATVGNKTIGIPGGAANTVFRLGWLERAEDVVVNRGSTGPAGTLTVYVLDEWGRKRTIATGTFT